MLAACSIFSENLFSCQEEKQDRGISQEKSLQMSAAGGCNLNHKIEVIKFFRVVTRCL